MSETTFSHQPLDYDRPSIRIVKLYQGRTGDGLIQCRMFHALNESIASRQEHDQSLRYTCVSYTWGRADRHFPIRINGRIFHVRENLYQFLEVASAKYSNRGLWIDALCIDQSNTLERNHQVQQMGQIFSQAEEVLMWLGRKPQIGATLQKVQEKIEGTSQGHWTDAYARRDNHERISIRGASLELAGPHGTFCNDDYWSRAWITQEIVLAKRATVLVGEKAMTLQSIMSEISMPDTPFYHVTEFIIQQKKSAELGRTSLTSTWNVINFLHHFRNRECYESRDRIYSLLALCRNGNALTVSYDIVEDQVFRQTLSTWRESLCLCSAAIVAQALWPHKFDYPSSEEAEKPVLRVTFLDQLVGSTDGRRLIACSNHDECLGDKSLDDSFILCLYAVCDDISGHVYWRPRNIRSFQELPNNQIVPGDFYIASRTYSGIQWKAFRGQVLGEKTTIEVSEHVHSTKTRGKRRPRRATAITLSLYLNLHVLVEIFRTALTPRSLSLRRCANLWHSNRDSSTVDIKRGLVTFAEPEGTYGKNNGLYT